MQKLIISFLLILSCLTIEAHSGKARFHVMIDTDGAADDLRAICMLLGNREVEVLSITTSEGALLPNDAAQKTMSLLRFFYHEGIPVGVGQKHNTEPPIWRKQSEQINWGNSPTIVKEFPSAKDLMIRTIEEESEKVIIICLGSLTNLNDMLTEKPQLKEGIERVIWYNGSINPSQSANYDADAASADKVLASGIRMEIISMDEKNPLVIDEAYIKMISEVDNQYAQKIVETHTNGVLQPVVAAKHMKAWDDLAITYLFAPELFTSKQEGGGVSSYIIDNAEMLNRSRKAILEILTGKPDSESRVFFGFPDNPDLYAADVAPVVKDIIAQHGRSEWRAGVLTNELHGHLGIYAIVGVKMGIRAREYFNIGVDDIIVVSYAGLNPPISCLNDGLQVSTGGTLGHGLISVSTDGQVRPEASFDFKGKVLRLKLKPEYAMQIRNDVEEGIRLHGNLTEDYWLHIRELAIKYWQEFDRHEIFEMSVD